MNYIKAFVKSNRIPLLLAICLLLFICIYKNQPFVEYVPVFQFGVFGLWFIVGYLILNRWKKIKEIGLGPKYVWIPLAIISGSAVLRIIVYHDQASLAGALVMAMMFGLYVVSRQYGEKALSFFMPVTIIGAISIIVQATVSPQLWGNPGLFNNEATAAEFLVFGWIVSPRKHQWWMAAIVVSGLFFTGAPEAAFYVAGIGLFILIRRDWSRKIALPMGVLGMCALLTWATGFIHVLWDRSYNMVDGTYTALTTDGLTQEEKDALLNKSTGQRWLYTWRLQREIQPLGYGVDMTNSIRTTNPDIHVPHNILLLVTDQLGPVAALAWISGMIIGIRKTKWKYGFLSLILFGVFQPFVWTEMAPYMWAMAGSSTTSTRSSYIFREA